SMNGLFAELYGKETGCNGGKAGSMDLSMGDCHFYGGAILAGTPPIADGVALAMKLNREKSVVVTATGEAATDEGIYWESLNYASLHQLPVLFLCENNY